MHPRTTAKLRFRFIVLAISLIPALARATDVSTYFIAKRQYFNQTDAGPPVFQNATTPYTFSDIVNESAPGLVVGLSMRLPDGTAQTGTSQSGGFYGGSSFPTLAALNEAYPVGQYVLTITTVDDGIKVVTNNLPASVYPSVPHINDFNAAQNINPRADFALTWDAFTNSTANDQILFKISDANGDTVFTDTALSGLSTSVVIPGNTLTANASYSAGLTFDKIIETDTTSYPGATGQTFFRMQTAFPLQTTNPPGLFLIATNGAVGGGATSGTNGLEAILSGTNVGFQLISSNGTLIGPLTVIGSGTSFPNAAFGGGKYLVYWDDNFITNGASTFGQIISPDGVVVGSPFLIPSSGNGAPRALASDGTNFLAVLEDNGVFYGQIVTPAGTLSGAKFLISGQEQNGGSAAATFGKTDFLVVWQSNNGNQGNTNQAFGAFVSGRGTAGIPFQIGQIASVDQNPLAVAFDGTNFLAVWPWDPGPETQQSVTNWDLHGRVVSQSGTFPGNELALVTDPGSQYFPSLTFDGANYLLAWGDSPAGAALTGSEVNIRFEFLNRSGSAIGPKFTLFTPQGTAVPAFGGVQAVANRIFAGALFASPIVDTNGNFQGFASGAEYGMFIPTSTAPPQLAVNSPLTSRQFSISLMGTPGINYAIQANANLSGNNWTALVTNSPTNGPFSYTDTGATNRSRFYRAVAQ